MARRILIWHLGLPDAARPVVGPSLAVHADRLADLGVSVAATPHEADLATRELLHTHDGAGLRRRDVEGTWARVADRVWAHRGVSVVSTPGLCAADGEQLRLALDPLIGIEVHLVLTAERLADQVYGAWVADLLDGGRTGLRKHADRVTRPLEDPRRDEVFWAGHDLAAVASRWGWTLHDERVHVVTGEPEAHWAAVLDLAKVEQPTDLPPAVASYADPAAAVLLREVNRRAEEPLTRAGREVLLADGEDGGGTPRLDLRALETLPATWGPALASHDVRGDLAWLTTPTAGEPVPGPRVRLALAAQVLAESLAEQSALRDEVTRLQAEVERLDRKRRSWKRRAKERDRPDAEAEGLRAVG